MNSRHLEYSRPESFIKMRMACGSVLCFKKKKNKQIQWLLAAANREVPFATLTHQELTHQGLTDIDSLIPENAEGEFSGVPCASTYLSCAALRKEPQLLSPWRKPNGTKWYWRKNLYHVGIQLISGGTAPFIISMFFVPSERALTSRLSCHIIDLSWDIHPRPENIWIDGYL